MGFVQFNKKAEQNIKIDDISIDDIRKIQTDYIIAAQKIDYAGFDGIQINMGNNFYLARFMNPYFNQRDDKYGGNTENRVRISSEIIKVIKKTMDMHVSCRINPWDVRKGGITADESIAIACELEKAGADSIQLTARTISQIYDKGVKHPFLIYVDDLIDDKTLLIICDVHRASYLDNEELYNKCKNKIVIDHHRLSSDAIRDAKVNAKINNIENARFICADASDAAEQLAKEGIKADTVIVDPPRKGCEESLLNTVALDFAPKRIVYVSCDVATLARDTAILEKTGYKLIEYTPCDLFPRTAHVETVALLSQRRPDEHIDITIDLTEFDTTAAELKATYPEIKEYVLNKFGLKVSSLYISQVKTKCGIIERENYNKGKAGHRVPQCPKEKEDAIMDALKHFKMI